MLPRPGALTPKRPLAALSKLKKVPGSGGVDLVESHSRSGSGLGPGGNALEELAQGDLAVMRLLVSLSMSDCFPLTVERKRLSFPSYVERKP
jgi:hypothetical protein